jgi:hypothetical protein
VSVRDGAGRDLAWFRSGSDLHVLLAEPLEAGGKARLVVEYKGVLLDELESRIFRVRDTYAWYPRAGTRDRATYEATLRWPKKYQLFASGRTVHSGLEGDLRVERRILDVHAMAFSFEVGAFGVIRERIGHVELTVAFSRSTLVKDAGATEQVVQILRDALPFYEERFGPYPLDYLTVVTIPRAVLPGIPGVHHALALPRRAARTRLGAQVRRRGPWRGPDGDDRRRAGPPVVG